jgi:hypothetical protein
MDTVAHLPDRVKSEANATKEKTIAMSRSTIGPAANPEALHAVIEDGLNRRHADALVAADDDDARVRQ